MRRAGRREGSSTADRERAAGDESPPEGPETSGGRRPPGSSRGPADPGLCGRCANARSVETGKGSRFLLCELSKVDPAYPRYPRLPVRSCPGFQAERGDDDG